MILPQRYFPWRVARSVFIGQLGFVLVMLLICGFSLRYYVYSRFVRLECATKAVPCAPTDVTEALGDFDSYLTGLLLSTAGVSIVYLAYAAWRQSAPLGRLIQRARELRRGDALNDEPVSIEDLEEDPGEWLDLERALFRMHKDLRKKTGQLSREREELSALIGAASDAILAINLDGDPLFFNSQFAAQFGAKAALDGQGSIGRAPRLDEAFRSPEILAVYRATLEDGERHAATATAHVLRESRPRHFSISVAPLKTHDGKSTYGAIGIFHDVTELKAAEQIRIEFVANASHELRTPLTSIKGYVDTLRGDLKTGRLDEAPRFLEIVSRNVDRLIFLVSDLLDLSTIESGSELKRAQTPTREVTEAALRQLEDKRAAKKQTIKTRYDVDSIDADSRRLEQVILNLVQNAIKYIPDGKTIEIIWEPDPRGGTVLRVKDDGPGIPLDAQSRLFERFYRVDPGRSRDQGGTGLGLAIVKHILIKHGGQVQVISQPGVGSEFVCRFPL